ncbi:MAG: DUF4097 family beta strand repeat-containing protein [Planctomycetota bacterium]
MMHRTLSCPLAIALSISGAIALTACGVSDWDSYAKETSIRMGGAVDSGGQLETRSFEVVLEPRDDGVVAIRNLAGSVTVRQDDVDAVFVDATVYANAGDAYTSTYLDQMRWIQVTDDSNVTRWTLTYPLDTTRRVHYPWSGSGFEMKTNRYDGAPLWVTTRRNDQTITMYTDLVITCPAGTELHLSNLAGPIDTSAYTGTLDLTTYIGDVNVDAADGTLAIDGSVNPVVVGRASGVVRIDTGSGDVKIGIVDGDSLVDTGSGTITIDDASGSILNADTGSGGITIGAINLDELIADTGSGGIAIGTGHAEVITADTGSGGIRVDGATFHRMVADTGSGGITIQSDMRASEYLECDTGSGSVTIMLHPDAAFTLNADQGSGSMYIGFDDAAIHGTKYDPTGATRGDDGVKIIVDTGSGNCTVKPMSAN